MELTHVKHASTVLPHSRCMAKKFPIAPAHPERNCWGCDKYCRVDDMACGNGSERTQHPIELFGPGWAREGLDPLLPEKPAGITARE